MAPSIFFVILVWSWYKENDVIILLFFPNILLHGEECLEYITCTVVFWNWNSSRLANLQEAKILIFPSPASDSELFRSQTYQTNVIRIKANPNYLEWMKLLIHKPILITAELNLKEEITQFSQTAYKRRYNNYLCIRFSTWKVWRLNQTCFKVYPKSKFFDLARWEKQLSWSKLKQAFLIDSDVELSM